MTGAEVVFYRPEREAQVLQRIISRNAGPLDGASMAYIFREIMSACLALEKPLQVAYLGPEGTFTQGATIKHFGHAAICVPQATIDAVFAQVESGECNYGVVPVENSTEGMVSHTLDNFMDSSAEDFRRGGDAHRPPFAGGPGYSGGEYYPYLRAPAGARPVPQLAGQTLAPYRA